MFPIQLPTDWQLAEQHNGLNQLPELKDWVCCESSLTVRIKELGVSFSVEVLQQSHQPLTASLQSTLDTQDKEALVREVVLKQGNVPLVYAQTIMPVSTVNGTEKRLAELGNQSLGQVLFQSKQTIRGPIECTEVTPESELGRYICGDLLQPFEKPIFIRRSLFTLSDYPLLVNECFLPSLIHND